MTRHALVPLLLLLTLIAGCAPFQHRAAPASAPTEAETRAAEGQGTWGLSRNGRLANQPGLLPRSAGPKTARSERCEESEPVCGFGAELLCVSGANGCDVCLCAPQPQRIDPERREVLVPGRPWW